jgi:heterodisulfide reductase subunit A
VGSFASRIEAEGRTLTVNYGAAVVATGGHESRPDEYMYANSQRIMTHLEFDSANKEGILGMKDARCTVFIQCVGSREPHRPYCSRVCCAQTMKSAVRLKTAYPGMEVVVLYRDIRTYGKREDLYHQARELGVHFIRYNIEQKPRVRIDAGELHVAVIDPILQRPVSIAADYIVLAAAIDPTTETHLVDLFKCDESEEGFLNEAHPNLRPVDMSVDGLFLAGLCNYPKPIDESIAQAQAAAARAAVLLAKDQMQLDEIKSRVTEACDGCALCLDVCPYQAIGLEEFREKDGNLKKRIQTDPAICRGCGLCAATCPKEGVQIQGFTLEHLRAQVNAALTSPGFMES